MSQLTEPIERPTRRNPVSGVIRLVPGPRRWGSSVLVLLVAALLWEGTARTVQSIFLPPLTAIGAQIMENWLSGPAHRLWMSETFTSMMGASLRRLVPAFVLGCLAGAAAGIAIGLSARVRELLYPLVHFLRSIPSVALLPLFIVLLGLGDLMKTWLIGVAVIWPVLINVVDGVRSVDPLMRDTLHSYGASAAQRVRWLVVPAMTPHLFAGLRIATMVGLAVMTVAEMYASGDGVGHHVLYSQRRFDTLSMWSGVFALAALGIAANVALSLAERRLLAWHRGARTMSG
jgi:ABC-type nitrate/sulfonate/bicarbonate transport system permease component